MLSPLISTKTISKDRRHNKTRDTVTFKNINFVHVFTKPGLEISGTNFRHRTYLLFNIGFFRSRQNEITNKNLLKVKPLCINLNDYFKTVNSFKFLHNHVTEDTIWSKEITRIAITKNTFNRKRKFLYGYPLNKYLRRLGKTMNKG